MPTQDSVLKSLEVTFDAFPKAAPTNAEKGSAFVVGAAQSEEGAGPSRTVKAAKFLSPLWDLLSGQQVFEGKTGSQASYLSQRGLFGSEPSHFFIFGIGKPKDAIPQNILSWGGKVGQALRAQKITEADIYLDSFINTADSNRSPDAPTDFAGRPTLSGIPSKEEFLEKFLLGLFLGLYKFDRYKTKKSANKTDSAELAPQSLRILTSFVDKRRATHILERVRALAAAAYLTRDLQTTPGGDLPPAALAREAQAAGKEAGFSVTVWDEKKLQAENMNGILTIGKGSVEPPRFIIMEYKGKSAGPTLVLVGKGVTFDTGGVCLKPAPGMEEMKMDMSGAASVVGALYALARLKAPLRVIGLVASAENMNSGSAVRPGDIYAAHDGQTVEVINTDAEGRVVLADALSYAKKYEPDAVIDIATLTGACVIALGHAASGIMGNNGALIDGFRRASDKAGEKTWELPLYEEYAEDMISKVADYRNIGMDRGGGSQKGGAFLNFFVKDAYPWIHLDVAGTADSPKPQGSHCPPDVGTAVPLRALVEFAEHFSTYFTPSAKKSKKT